MGAVCSLAGRLSRRFAPRSTKVYNPSISKKPAPQRVTEKTVCRYLGNNVEMVKELAKAHVCKTIDGLTKEELFDRFWDGRLKYGGEFDVESIACIQELKFEALDVVLYMLFL